MEKASSLLNVFRKGKFMKHKLILNNVLCLALAAAFVGCATGTQYNRSTGQYIDDKSTAQRVRNNLGKDSLVKATKVHVESFRGNVHLTGFVDYPVQKQHAEQIARNTEGVEWVKDDIIVKSELPGNQISGQINEPSGAKAKMSGSAGSASVQSSQFEASSSGSPGAGWVRGNKGTLSTERNAEIHGDAAGAEVRGSATTSGAGAQYNTTTQGAASSDLASRVRSDFQSDTTLNAQNVTVEQDGNKIILRGTVSTKEQKEALEAKAKAIPGVKSVSNKIDVQR